ncbi:hypothetical protein HFN49_31740 [Rhizobium leguminosarum]|uniref:hypothetical protein n=1 Tax=Rhizobium ruizarguesonis TaxID=2081791 RepID=UPI001A9833BC|nr:hypothetical protein [Rhizobium ruizarguesonis]MBY5890750.1 hypothetical protein [Rhizobium leguminosarum]QSZ05117.1 hypothetical protein J3P73_31385 [Rhizobium ruizarguesonis]
MAIEPKVSLNLRLIANGVTSVGDGKTVRLKAVLIVTPKEEDAGGPVNLANWPSEIVKVLKKHSVNFYYCTAGAPTLTAATKIDDVRFPAFDGASGIDAVKDLWRDTIGKSGPSEPWSELIADIKASASGNKIGADLQGSYVGDTSGGTGQMNEYGALLAEKHDPATKLQVCDIVSNQQSHYALETESARAQRVVSKLCIGPYLPGDQLEPGGTLDQLNLDQMSVQSKESFALSLLPESDTKRNDTKKLSAKLRTEVYLARFKAAIDATQDERKSNLAIFKAVKGVLTGSPMPVPSPRRTAMPVAPASSVLGGGPQDTQPRAGHVYGSWTQWSLSYNNFVSALRADPAAVRLAETSDATDQLLAIYYALQGDPLLARLFGFAFDVEFAIDAELIKASGGALWLAATSGGDAEIWTAALYAEVADDACARFWPAPRFDTPGSYPPPEQKHGVFHLGDGYDLTSLDVRGAVSDALDAVDKGAMQQSFGWTLLDANRAARAARDLAVSDYQVQQRRALSPVLLYAEELTVGRRLDVGVGVFDGSGKVTGLKWRSLMTRLVRFHGLSSRVETWLTAATKSYPRPRGSDGHTLIDEASFQLVSRSLPIMGDPGAGDRLRNVEALVEEGFVSWGGSSLAALACRSDNNASPESILHFQREYGLPTGSLAPDLRLLPLRFGVGYVFSLRSAFLGGGSPTVEESVECHEAQDLTWLLPPAAPKQDQSEISRIRLRRYRRQESINAPILLLPKHQVENRNGAMGFESPARAIVRTQTPSNPARALVQTPKPAGPPYVDVVKRATPEATMRIFVAPMAGMEFCSRHRVFDDPKHAKEILAGGLLDVEFDAEGRKFPNALIRRNTGFNADSLVYRREASTGNHPSLEATGGAYFRPLKTPAKRSNGKAYLPDPAAQTMSLRLRIVGADVYLAGDVSVDLYPAGVKYPNALPLLVNIVRRGDKPRDPPATAAADILKIVPGNWRIDENGHFGTGVRVNRVDVQLALGEQFDLEVTCLPTKISLAEWFALPENIAVQHSCANGSAVVQQALSDACADGAVGKIKAALNGARPSPYVGLGGYPVPDQATIQTIAETLLNGAKNNWPLTEIAGVATLRVAHAVNAPLVPATLRNLESWRPGTPGLVFYAKKAAPAAVPPPKDEVGSANLVLSGEILVDLDQIDTIEVVASAVSPNGEPIDDPARGRGVLAKRSGRWPQKPKGGTGAEYVRKSTIFGFDVDPEGKTTLLPRKVTLLRIEGLPASRAAENTDSQPVFLQPPEGRLTRLDLGLLHAAALSGNRVEFRVASQGHPELGDPAQVGSHTRLISVTRPSQISDTKARKLQIEVLGISRFAHSFETAAMFSDDRVEHVLTRRQPLVPVDQQKSWEYTTAIWSRATQPPAPPAAKTPTLVFRTKRFALQDGKHVTQHLERHCSVRLRFERGMFSSGEGERIGIVLWPPFIRDVSRPDIENNVIAVPGHRPMTLSDFQDGDLGDGGQYISRWGGDPIREDASPQKGWFMPPSAFGCLNDTQDDAPWPHDPQYIGSVMMPIPTDTSGTSSQPAPPLEVALLTFEPYFDIDAEEWFVDVDITPSYATDPFIRLGLVRYQPNTINDSMKVSTPVRVWTQLPPRRLLKIAGAVQTGDLTVNALVSGQASTGVKPLRDDAKALLEDPKNGAEFTETWRRLQRPLMRMTIFHEGEAEGLGRMQHELAICEAWPLGDAGVLDGLSQWKLFAKIPKDEIANLGPGQFVAMVEELEERLPASYPSEPIALTDLLKKENLRESGPRFLARVPFLST